MCVAVFLKDCFLSFTFCFAIIIVNSNGINLFPMKGHCFYLPFVSFSLVSVLTGSLYQQLVFILKCDLENTFKYFYCKDSQGYIYFCMVSDDLAGHKIVGPPSVFVL